MLVWEMSAVSPSRLKYCYADYLLSCEVSWPPPFDEGCDGMIVVMVMEIRYVLESERALVMDKLRGAGRLGVDV